jgi:hypothetical protein
MVIDWKEFGPPVDVWKQILRMAISSDSWYEQLAFSFGKHPRMPVMPDSGEAK